MKELLHKICHWYFSKRALPYWCILVFDCSIVIMSGIMARIMSVGLVNTADNLLLLLGSLCCYLVYYVIFFRIFRTYSGVLRYSSFKDLSRIVSANFCAAVLIFATRKVVSIDQFLLAISWKELAITCLLATFGMWLLRVMVKYVFDMFYVNQNVQRVFIYGTKEGGVALAKNVNNEHSQYTVVGFVSDNEDDTSHDLMTCPIFYNDEKVVEQMRRHKATVFMVSPLMSDAFCENQTMINALINANIKILMFSKGQEWDGKSDLHRSQLKEVQVEDLLPRNQINVDMEAIGNVLRDKCIMITGAAGSIGFEIVGQVARFKPSQLVLIDQAETPLHDVRLTMQRNFPEIPCVTVTASICHQHHMEVLFEKYQPEYLFHAAAYKHVPMMEDNPGEAVVNNIYGTRIVADLAVKYGVKKFVMISTDKAVNPTNVMGCSKRICEIYCQAKDKWLKEYYQQNNKTSGEAENVPTQFVTTRFGNVLGSNGSVIPLFREQLQAGGPLTVTHPDIIRFFMLIPEACRLVLQAGAMGHGGEIFVFDMGKPVKIADLARRMIQLSGAKDVEIKYTGLREGEKLYEEVLSKEENTKPSSHPKIKLASVREMEYDEVSQQIEQLIKTSVNGYDDMIIVKQMKQIVPEFKSKNSKYEVLDEDTCTA